MVTNHNPKVVDISKSFWYFWSEYGPSTTSGKILQEF